MHLLIDEIIKALPEFHHNRLNITPITLRIFVEIQHNQTI
jgi:hypothetical protein